jgi:hypothetical protein
LRESKLDARSIINAYSGRPEPWCLLDTHYRHMERRFARFSAETYEDEDKLREVIQKCRHVYSEAVAVLMDAWTEALAASGFQVNGVRGQERVFRDHGAPVLRGRHRVAYFLVDALRFEMGRELAGSLADEFEVELHPALGKLPSVTEIGMAALLPEADKGLELAEDKGEKLVVRVGGEAVRDRASRLDYLGQHAGVAVLPFKLGEISKPATKRKIDEGNPSLIVVTSQEIDRLGEMAEDEEETRTYMDEVLNKLSRAVLPTRPMPVKRR